MKKDYRLKVEIVDMFKPASALGVLLPVPPTTPQQKVHRITLDPAWAVAQLRALNGVQSACFATVPDHAWMRAFAFDIFDHGDLVAQHFTAHDSSCADPGEDARELASGLSLDNGASTGERLLRIIECVSRKFKYQSGYNNDEPLTCNVLTGNCLSINSAIMRLAQLAGVRTAYYIGFYFAQGRPLATDDWHCWIGTLTDRGYESWDVAHQLQHGGGSVHAGLNPIPGLRFAMSVGRNLVFQLPFAKVEVPHLCEPRWIFPDGSSQRCAVRVTAELIGVLPAAVADIIPFPAMPAGGDSHASN